MALFKPIKQEDGVTTNYHRILYFQSTVNHHNSIVVVSYVDEESRGMEHPYAKCVTYETDYSPNMNTDLAYEYLKTLPIFAGAKDC